MFGIARLNSISKASTVLSSFTYISQTQASNVSSSASLTVPTVQAGDFLILFNGCGTNNSTTPPTLVSPSGWTNIYNFSTTTSPANRQSCFYKIATGSEGGTTITGMASGLAGNTLELIVYRPNASIITVTPGTVTSQGTGAVPTNQTLTLSGITAPSLGFAYYSYSTSATGVGSSTTTPTRQIALLVTTFGTYGRINTYENLNTAGLANSTISMTDNGTNMMASFTIQFA